MVQDIFSLVFTAFFYSYNNESIKIVASEYHSHYRCCYWSVKNVDAI